MTAQNSTNNPRPLIAAVLSGVIPGVGQLMAGDRRKARNLFIIDIVILAVLAFFFRNKVSILTAWLQPTSLALMMIANIILLGYRLWAAVDAYHTARGPDGRSEGTSRKVVVIGTIAIGLMLVTPHVVFAYYDVIQYDLITAVFGGNTASASTTDTAAPAPPATDETGATVIADEGTLTDETVVVAQGDPWDGVDRLNILLIGGDFGEGRTGIRTDTMITVSIDPETGETAMFSVPRNWTYAPLPAGMGVWDCDCYPELINELWVAGEQHPDAFPGPGTPSENAVKGVISEFLGIPIHYYAMVNLDGFVDIVDALGGVEIYVPTAVIDEEYPDEDGTTTERIDIQPGLQTFDGHLALAYSRSRNQDSDYYRMSRQRCVIEAMMEQADPTDLLLNFGKFADVIKETMITDIPVETLPQLVELLPKVDLENVVSIRFIPPEYHLTYRDDGKKGGIANIELVHEHVQLVIADPERAVEELGLEALDDLCGVPPES
jgi:LCP family protein required for cell wall assembly